MKKAITLVGAVKELKACGGKFYKPANVDKVYAIFPKVGIKKLGLIDFMRSSKKRGGMEVVEVEEGSPLQQRLQQFAI